ncbi:hypothetical protein ACLB2K_046213 [Fragaria x ananassa]
MTTTNCLVKRSKPVYTEGGAPDFRYCYAPSSLYWIWYENPDMELKRKEAEQLKDDKVKQTHVGGDVDKADVGLALHL